MMPLRDRPDSMSRRDGVGCGRDDVMTPATRTLTGSTPAREATNYLEVVFTLLFSLLAFGWLVLIRDVRVGLPGHLTAPRREAVGTVVTSPTGGATHAPNSGVRP